MASSSSIYSRRGWDYDVFLSFRGKDTRYGFTDYLHSDLVGAGIRTFRDDNDLRVGEEFGPELIRAVEESKISIVIFSRNYADSTWCLDEVAKIMECRRKNDQLVLPVFYDVDPSDIRKQTGRIGEAFAKHQVRFGGETEMVKRWRAALLEAANLSGFHIDLSAGVSEPLIIKQIIKVVLSKVSSKYLDISPILVGMASRVHKVISLLSTGLDDIRMVGIFGMGGVGKSTIAKCVYNEIIMDFDHSCFIENVREASEEHNGVVRLQEQILSAILKTDFFKLTNVANGVTCLKERLCSKKVLIVLDDLDDKNQLDSLAGECAWFGPGSRIIITTRDEHLLKQSKIDSRYNATELMYKDPLKLFSLNAFGMKIPPDDYMEISKQIVTYVGGLPLALNILGRYMLGKSMLEWENAFAKLQRSPHGRIQAVLRISYDGLQDDHTKDIFLDMACFFNGMDKEYVVDILNGCCFFSVIGIRDLIDRCLLADHGNKLMMHNLIRDMGRQIVQQSHKDPGKRSRLWIRDDIQGVLRKQMGTRAIEGVVPALPLLNEKPVSSKTFKRMYNLRLLKMDRVQLTGSFEHLPEELKWLSWQHCPFEYLPSDFLLENLVVLDLQYSNLTCVWQGMKFLKNMKVLNLGYCRFLTTTPDLTGSPKLEKLYLHGCTSLVEFDQSIALLKALTYLNLEDCNKLQQLPSCISELKSLKHLNLNGCSSLDKLPDNLQNMDCLSELFANGTTFKQLPESLGHLKNLKTLSLAGCNTDLPAESLSISRFLPDSISSLTFLKNLVLSDCNLSDEGVPIGLWSLLSLETLCLDGNNFQILPPSVGQLPKLEILSVNRCKSLQSLPELPPKLVRLDANGCTSMEILPNLSNANRFLHLYLMNCHRLAAIQGLDNLNSVRFIAIQGSSKLANTIGDSFFQEYTDDKTSDMYLTRRDIPNWFSHQSMGPSVSFNVPSHVGKRFLGMTLWIVYESSVDGPVTTHSPEAIIFNRTNDIDLRHSFPLSYGPHNPGSHSWVCHLPASYLTYSIKGGEEMEVCFEINQPMVVKQCGVHLIYKPYLEEDDEEQGPFVRVDRDVNIDNNTQQTSVSIVEIEETSDRGSGDKAGIYRVWQTKLINWYFRPRKYPRIWKKSVVLAR